MTRDYRAAGFAASYIVRYAFMLEAVGSKNKLSPSYERLLDDELDRLAYALGFDFIKRTTAAETTAPSNQEAA